MAKAAVVLVGKVINNGEKNEGDEERNGFFPAVPNRPSEPNERQDREYRIDKCMGQTHFIKGPGWREYPHVGPGVENSAQGLARIPDRVILDQLRSLELLLCHVGRLSQTLEFLQLRQVGSRRLVPIRRAACIAAVSDHYLQPEIAPKCHESSVDL